MRDALADKGYAVARGVLSKTGCAELERRVFSLFESEHERSRQVLYVDGQVPEGTPHLDALMYQWLNPHRYLDGLGTADLLDGPKVLATELLGAAPVLFQDLLLVKQPEQARFPWHQDFPFWPVDRPHGVVCWIPLTRNTAEGGGLRFLPESHRRGVLPVVDLHRGVPQEGDRPPIVVDDTAATCPRLEAGDAVFFSPLVLHGSPARRAVGRRIAWSSVWLHPDVRWDHGRAPAHPLCRQVVDGAPVHELCARSEDQTKDRTSMETTGSSTTQSVRNKAVI